MFKLHIVIYRLHYTRRTRFDFDNWIQSKTKVQIPVQLLVVPLPFLVYVMVVVKESKTIIVFSWSPVLRNRVSYLLFQNFHIYHDNKNQDMKIIFWNAQFNLFIAIYRDILFDDISFHQPCFILKFFKLEWYKFRDILERQ